METNVYEPAGIPRTIIIDATSTGIQYWQIVMIVGIVGLLICLAFCLYCGKAEATGQMAIASKKTLIATIGALIGTLTLLSLSILFIRYRNYIKDYFSISTGYEVRRIEKDSYKLYNNGELMSDVYINDYKDGKATAVVIERQQ